MEFLESESFKRLTNPGVVSLQLISPHNSRSTRVTVTSVTLAPGAEQPRHKHASSEQIWVAIAGEGTLLLAEQGTRPFKHGEVVRFEDGEIHGFKNTGTVPFVYLSVTSPPIDFSLPTRVRPNPSIDGTAFRLRAPAATHVRRYAAYDAGKQGLLLTKADTIV